MELGQTQVNRKPTTGGPTKSLPNQSQATENETLLGKLNVPAKEQPELRRRITPEDHSRGGSGFKGLLLGELTRSFIRNTEKHNNI